MRQLSRLCGARTLALAMLMAAVCLLALPADATTLDEVLAAAQGSVEPSPAPAETTAAPAAATTVAAPAEAPAVSEEQAAPAAQAGTVLAREAVLGEEPPVKIDPLAVPDEQLVPPADAPAPDFNMPEMPQWIPEVIDVSSLQLPSDLTELINHLAQGYVQPDSELSIEDSVSLAVTYNHNLNSKRLEAAASTKDIEEVWTMYYPQLGMQGKGYWQDSNITTNSRSIPVQLADGSTFDLGTILGGGEKEDFHRSLAFSLTQKIYDFGITQDAVGAAEAQHALKKHTLDMTEQQLVHDVVAAYYTFNLALAANRVRDNEMQLAQEILRQTKIQYEVGVVPRLDVIRAEARVEQARSSFIAQQAQVGNTAAYFFSLLGQEDQRYVPALVTASLTEIGSAPPDLNDAIKTAQYFRPELQMQYDALEAVHAAKDLTSNRPILQAYGNAMYQQPAGQGGTDTYEYGVELNWNLYTGGKDQVQREKNELTIKSIEEAIHNLEAQLELDVTTSWNDTMSARAATDSAKKNLDLSSEALRTAAVGYSAGVTPYIDFQDALDQNVAAAIGYLSALSHVKIAQINLSRAEGFPLGFPGDTRADTAGDANIYDVLGIESKDAPQQMKDPLLP
jgi:outer membrane protein TolC